MRVRLANQRNPKRVLSMSQEAWFRILELAEEYGWQPLGTFQPGGWLEPGETLAGYWPENASPRDDGWDPGYLPRMDEARLVLMEDALNLADALDQAFLEYEPEPVYKFEGTSLATLPGLDATSRPSLGAITALMDFCRLGEFSLESF